MKERLSTIKNNWLWVTLVIIMILTNVISFSGNSYRWSIDFNHGVLTKKVFDLFEEKKEELSED